MSQISPPIRILLIAVIGLVAVYMLFLRPKTDAATPAAAVPASTTPVPAKDIGAKTNSKPGAIVQNAIKDTTDASARSKVAAGEAPGGLASDQPAATSTGASTTGTGSTATSATGVAAAPPTPVTKQVLAELPKDVRGAVAKHKVLVLLFYNNRSADDRAVRRELSKVNRYGGQVVVAAHWIKSVARYQAITRGVDVEQSPTIVVADRNLKAESLVGYVEHKTIDQAVVDAIRASGGSLIKNPYFRKLDALCGGAQAEVLALPQPTNVAMIPAYLVGVDQAAIGMHKQAVAITPPKQYKRFHHRFVLYTENTERVASFASVHVANTPKDGLKTLKSAVKGSKQLDDSFVSANGAHGLSCF
jgi:hypothetical protein